MKRNSSILNYVSFILHTVGLNLNVMIFVFSQKLVQEESLPEGLLRMNKVLPPLPLTLQQCQGHRIRLKSQFTSTWLSVAAKNIE